VECTREFGAVDRAWEVFPGNRTDVTPLPEIVTTMETQYGQAQRREFEAAFRMGKSDWLLRPIFPQKTVRVDAHIRICSGVGAVAHVGTVEEEQGIEQLRAAGRLKM